MSNSDSHSALRNTWEAAAPGWAKWEDALSAGFEDVTDNLLDLAAVGPSQRILDIACGAGAQTIQAAKRVGTGGTVVASDISGTMLEQVRQNAAKAELTNIQIIEGSAEELVGTELPFDAAISRLGLMLFPEPAAAVRAIGAVLKPGGRFAALVFTTPANNPFMAGPMRILLQHAGKEAPAAGRPGIFALGGDGVLETLLSEAGLSDIKTATVRAPLRLPTAFDALQMIQQAFGAYRAVVADLSDTEKEAAWSDVEAGLKKMEGDNGFSTELEFIIGAGAKPL